MRSSQSMMNVKLRCPPITHLLKAGDLCYHCELHQSQPSPLPSSVRLCACTIKCGHLSIRVNKEWHGETMMYILSILEKSVIRYATLYA